MNSSLTSRPKSRIPVLTKISVNKKESAVKAPVLDQKKSGCSQKLVSSNSANLHPKTEKDTKTNVNKTNLLNSKTILQTNCTKLKKQNDIKIPSNVLKENANTSKKPEIIKKNETRTNILKKSENNKPNQQKVLINQPICSAKEKNSRINKSNEQKTLVKKPVCTVMDKKSGLNKFSQHKLDKFVPSSVSSVPQDKSKNVTDFCMENSKKTTAVEKDTVTNVSKRNQDNLPGKENKLLPSYIHEQKDIKFEADEKFRKMILSGGTDSPSLIRPGQKLSLNHCDRPSIYTSMYVPKNPVKEALNACLSIKRDRSSLKQINRQAQLTPLENRNSFYSADPKREVYKALQAIKEKRLKSASAKKVSFNTNVEVWSPKEKLNENPTPFKPSENHHLTDITERSKENTPDSPICKTETTTVFAPQPVSIFSKSSCVDISSPEFLINTNNRKEFVDNAPISTPYVLRSLAKNSALSPQTELSPVRQKLDFSEAEKESPKNEGPTKTPTLLKKATYVNLADYLADQECGLLLNSDGTPVVCGRYLHNPIAITLTEGDEMHFIPIKL